MSVILISFIVCILFLFVFIFGIAWWERKQISDIQKNYLASLNKQFDQEDNELEEMIYDLDVESHQNIYYHGTIQ
jgi:predicted PurR-regulated permease PerM